MSLKGVCQILVYFESFKNWDLNDQGIYMIKAYVNRQSKGQIKDVGLPYHLVDIKKQLRSRKKNKIRSQPEIDDGQYRSKSFLIRYNDEQIDLDEAVIFRMEVDTFPQFDTEGVHLHFDLHYALEYFYQLNSQDPIDFRKVATARFKLFGVEGGFARFASVDFGELYRSTVNISVFSILMDYKFRMWKCPREEKTPKEVAREKVENLQGYFKWLWYYFGKTPQQFYDSYIKHIRYHSLNGCREWSRAISVPLQPTVCLSKCCIDKSTDDTTLVDVSEEQFSNYLATYTFDVFNEKRLQNELQNIRIQTYTFFQNFIRQLQNDKLKKHLLQEKYHESMKERAGQFILRDNIKEEDLTQERLSGKEKRNIAKKLRKSKDMGLIEQVNVESTNGFPKRSEQPIIFHEISQLKPPTEQPRYTNILYVFAHGFQGSSYDMLNAKNMIKQFYPKANYLVSRANQGHTDGDIIKMGERLAKEIDRFIIQEELEKGLQINFVGHSLGGLILRASLAHLEKYAECFGTFMTFASPHLGYLQGMKTMIMAGLWAIKSWNKTESLEQLTMTDSQVLHQTTMFKLSKLGSLKNFKNLVFLSSYEDSYVPWHSARVHCYKSSIDSERALIEKTMVQNILGGGCIEKIQRIDVSFQIVQRNMDSMIGRTAHMRFLSDENLLKMILYCMPDLFS